jgi:hypothetical protein
MLVRLEAQPHTPRVGGRKDGSMTDRTRTRRAADQNGDGVETPAIVSAQSPGREPEEPVSPPTVKNGWLEVSLPATATVDDKALRAEIRTIHRQAYTDLAFIDRCRWAGYNSVESKLRIAAESLQAGLHEEAARLVASAQATYREQLGAQRKVWYLWGVLIGIGLLGGLVVALHAASNSLSNVISQQFALQLLIFAGMGTLASVLMRLGSFRIETYATRLLVMISGISRPLVAVFVTFAMYTILRSHLQTVTVNGTDLTNVKQSSYVYFTAAFLCGFSERFGKDLISRAGGAFGGGAATAAAAKGDD